MKKKLLATALVLTMGLSLSACALETEANAASGTENTVETGEASKSAYLLADEYELMKDMKIPVRTTNADLEAERLEPEHAEKISIDGAQGEGKLNLYVFRPENYKEGDMTPVIYYIHGGGYQFGNTGLFEGGIQDVANGANATAVSVDYTLSTDPSYQYPMELEDAYAGLLYVYEHADELNVDKDRIVIEGDSAGGGLTARLALYNRDKGEVPLKGQVLIYPMLDYRTAGKEDIYKNEYAGEFMWTREDNLAGWEDLKEGQKKELTDEEMIYFSPAVASVEQLKGLPETFVIVGSLDLFCDEDIDYAQKLMQAGVFTELYVEPGVPHAYDAFGWTPQSERFTELKNHATKRMLGEEDSAEDSGEEGEYGELITYLLGLE